MKMTLHMISRITLLLAISAHLSLCQLGFKDNRMKCIFSRVWLYQGVCPRTTLKLTIMNVLVEPFWKYHANVDLQFGDPLIKYLEKAAEKDDRFKFTARYDGEKGYYITEINELADNLAGKWRFSEEGKNFIPVGLDKYIPNNGESIILSFSI